MMNLSWKIAGLTVLSVLMWMCWWQIGLASESRSVIINELMWMGSEASSGDEWIELKNVTDEEVDISGWELTKISSGSEKLMFRIPNESKIGAKGFFLISKYNMGHEFASGKLSMFGVESSVVTSDVSLSNSALQIKLYDGEFASGTNLIDVAGDSGKPISGSYKSGENWNSMERNLAIGNGDEIESWHSSNMRINLKDGAQEYATPGAENSQENLPPVVELGEDRSVKVGEMVSFGTEVAEDPEGGELDYKWIFGDGIESEDTEVTYKYNKSGTYELELRVTDDGGLEASDSVNIEVDELKLDYSKEIVVNEVLPNPEGKDEGDSGPNSGEFIELFNEGSDEVSLEGWKLDDEEGGSSPYEIGAGKVIKGGEYIVFYRGETNLSLNNTSDKARLLNPSGEVSHEVEFSEVNEGKSYAREDNGEYSWTSELTPGEKNKLVSEVEEGSNEDSQDDQDEKSTNESSSNTSNNEDYQKVKISEAYDKSKNDKVEVTGVVTCIPGVLSDDYFYIQDDRGIKIYSSKGTFPELKIGDDVKVKGKVSESSGQKKINISEKADIEVIGSGKKVDPAKIKIKEINEDKIGSLVTLSGDISKQSGSSFDIDDGSGEFKVSVLKKTGIKKPSIETGEAITVSGIVDRTSSGLRLVVRRGEDLGGNSGGSALEILPKAGGKRNYIGIWLIVVAMLICILSFRIREVVIKK